jgi:hypothetical protein
VGEKGGPGEGCKRWPSAKDDLVQRKSQVAEDHNPMVAAHGPVAGAWDAMKAGGGRWL